MPNALYHWSKATPCDFACQTATFKTNAQGRVYCVANLKTSRGTTKIIHAQSLISFEGQALELFAKHPMMTILGFKRCGGQYWSKRFGDLQWDATDAFYCDRVWVVTNARIVPIKPVSRFIWQRTKWLVIKTVDIFLAILISLALIDVVLNRFGDYSISTTLGQTAALLSTEALVIIGCAAVAIICVAPCFGRVNRSAAPDGATWNVEAALDHARRMAKTKLNPEG